MYDSKGNVTFAINAHNDTTRFWYRVDGLVDSMRAPGNTAVRRFIYDTLVWRNLLKEKTELGNTMYQITFDALGRDSLRDRKIRVSIKPNVWCPGGVCFRWQRTELFYNVAGQLDSTRQRQTGLCADPCDSIPSFGSPERRVSVRFDRAGRDSIRVNESGGQTLYLYDRLGRLVSRRPWVDSMAVKDSLVYDIAGNLKKSITRRGDIITSDFDTRNRDTLTVIPGVGTLRRAYAGPLDQLTRTWFDSPVDPIGGINGELRWKYDQRGRMVAETTYTGATARATSFSYDAFERPSTTTDALGTWTTRYETDRGYADTLITPMGDTLTYFFDLQSRPASMKIQGGGKPLQRAPSWGQSGVLGSLSNWVFSSPTNPYGALLYTNTNGSDDAPAPLSPRYLEKHDTLPTTPVDTLRDTVSTDAYGRVIAWKAWTNSTLRADENYSFNDQDDLLTAAGDSYTYDPTTRRLISRTTGAGTWNYSYDRAGNLIEATLGATTWIYTYDALNRLTSATRNAVLIARYAYDVLGRRIVKRVYSSASGGTVAYTRFVYHADHVAFETDSAGTIGLRYTWGLGVDDLAAVRDAAGNHYYGVQDGLHSVRGLVRRDGTWMVSWRYSLYGAGMDSSGSAPIALRYRWTGREIDSETGFFYFRARYYDHNARRFVQEDPIGYSGGASLYSYTAGNPLAFRDPSGLMKIYQLLFYPRCACHGETTFILDGAFVSGGGGARVMAQQLELGFRQAMRDYLSYLRAYPTAVANAIAEHLGLAAKGIKPFENLAAADILEHESRPFSFLEFLAIRQGIEALPNERDQAMYASLLSQGRLFMNSGLERLKGAANAFTLPGAYIAFTDRYFGRPFVNQLATLEHEAGHWWGAATELTANLYACFWVPTATRCRQFR